MASVHRPLFYILAGLCCGLALGRHLRVEPALLTALGGFSLALLVACALRGWTPALLPCMVFLAIGALAAGGIPDPDRPPPCLQGLLHRQQVVLMGSISRSPEQRSDKTRMRVRLQGYLQGNHLQPVQGNLLLTVRDSRRQWRLGQRFLGRVLLRPVRNFNNPGAFDYRQYLANQHIWLTGYARSDRELVPLGRPDCPRWLGALEQVRVEGRRFLQHWLPGDLAGLYRALLLGERYALRPELRDELYGAGLGHLLAISGIHLGMVAGLSFLGLHFLLVRSPALAGRWGARPLAALSSFPAALAYALLTGMAIPALRATIMLAVFTVALLAHRTRDLINSLLLAAFIILLLSPEALLSASFQLSFISVGALVWVLPRVPVPACLRNREPGKWRWQPTGRRLYLFVAATLTISLFTGPVSLYYFHRLTPAGVIANLVAVPLVGFLVLPAGLLSLCLAPCFTQAAGFVLTLGALGLKAVLAVAAGVSQLAGANLWPGTPAAWQVVLIYFLLLLPFLSLSWRNRSCLLVGGGLLLLVSWYRPAGLFLKPSVLRVTYLDVGQGSAAVAELPGKAAMLIDGGGLQGSSFDIGRYVVAPYLWQRRIRHLDLVVLTHAHPDHYKGLEFIVSHFAVKEFWFNGVAGQEEEFRRLLESLAQRSIPCLTPEDLLTGRTLAGLDLKVLHPPPGSTVHLPETLSPGQLNDLSLVLRLRYKKVSFLFPGDIQKEAEYRLLESPDLEAVQVLLMPHHGSLTSSSPPLLARLRPLVAVCSAGFRNRFHLPAAEVCRRYRSLGVRIFRTDHHGAVTVSTDGNLLKVKTFLDKETT